MHSPQSESVESVIAVKKAAALPMMGGPYLALVVLFAMNLLNYVDRYSFFAAGTHIQRALDIDDDWFGVLGVSFMIVYTIVSPVMGWMGDRYSRKLLLAGGVGLWSLATVGTAFSADFYHMFFWRALLGLGEASYGAIAPALIADLFPIKKRGRAMGVYYLALPVGTALGYIVGGKIADALGWQAVFFVVGLPGLVVALAGLIINDPGRGASEVGAAAQKPHRPQLKEYLILFRTPTFLFNTAGMAAVTYATGAYAAWGSTFYQRVHHLSATDAGRWIGLLLVGAGVLGIVLGMFLPDLLRKRTRSAYLLLASVAVLLAMPIGVVGILDRNYVSSLAFLFGASILLSMVLGPCNTVTANVIPANLRATAYATFIFLIHLFGDISSPVILGWISKHFGEPSVAQSPLGRFFSSIGASPVQDGGQQTNLTLAMLSVGPVLLLGVLFFLIGSRYLARDEDRAVIIGGKPDDASPDPYFHH
jgi:MFS transporter, Spinster family, sphingosine-1-phosphate transporter